VGSLGACDKVSLDADQALAGLGHPASLPPREMFRVKSGKQEGGGREEEEEEEEKEEEGRGRGDVRNNGRRRRRHLAIPLQLLRDGGMTRDSGIRKAPG
jgi:hypothetical protein